MNLYIYNYNNYYNRTIKKAGDSIADYSDYLYYGPVQGVLGFTPGDGVNTIQLLGSTIQMYDGKGDYLIVHNPQTDMIESRWFILDNERTRNGQWQLTLHRDLVADYYSNIIEAPCFIEKATITDLSNPLLFNSEQMTFNQIKTSEKLLKDKSGCPWLVGYYSKGANLTGAVPINLPEDLPIKEVLATGIEGWKFYKNCSLNTNQVGLKGPATTGSYSFQGTYTSGGGGIVGPTPKAAHYSVNILDGSTTRPSVTSSDLDFKDLLSVGKGDFYSAAEVKAKFDEFGISNLNYVDYSLNESLTTAEELQSYGGSTIKDGLSGKYYTCYVTSETVTERIDIPTGSGLYENLRSITNTLFTPEYTPSTSNVYYKLKVTYTLYKLQLTELGELEVKYNITANRLVTDDAPWDVFAIPYGDIKITDVNNTLDFITSTQNGLTTAVTMQANHPSVIYDIQLLPYCPIKDLIINDGEIQITNQKQYSLIAKNVESPTADDIVGIIFNVPSSSFSNVLSGYEIKEAQTALDKKINNECDKWRLTSPNYSNYFDFSVEKNNGIDYFNIDCTYKPFTPYIHINPNFKGLYGYNDDSPRGLVLGGDFSISQIIDQWQQYQIQNKNFQNIFDRQIQNMEVQNKYGRIQDIVGGIAGTIQGGASGAFVGSQFGGGYGAAIGAVVGTAASGIGAMADYKINEALRNEAMDYTKDLFGYNLGNIQALPDTISKVSALNKNNKIFPVLEYYTCKPIERKALENKIKYNGMTIMTIGTISDYVSEITNTGEQYIKAKLIRLENTEENNRIVNAIAGELNKGVFI